MKKFETIASKFSVTSKLLAEASSKFFSYFLNDYLSIRFHHTLQHEQKRTDQMLNCPEYRMNCSNQMALEE